MASRSTATSNIQASPPLDADVITTEPANEGKEIAVMIAARTVEIARHFPIEGVIDGRGVKLRGKIERVGPCPRCGGCDRFAISIRKQKWNCRGCRKGGDLIALIMFLDSCTFREACAILTGEKLSGGPGKALRPAHREQHPNADDYERRQHEMASWLWRRRRPIEGTPADRYLRHARGIACRLPPTLGFLPPSGNYPPSLIAAFGMVGETEPGVLDVLRDVDAVHITRLLPDGSDRERSDKSKTMIGRSLGSPLVLAPPNDLLGLAVTEGIEDALALHQALGMGAWAAGAAGRMPALAGIVPDYIKAVTLELHPDNGRHLAEQLADALRDRGIEVFAREAIA